MKYATLHDFFEKNVSDIFVSADKEKNCAIVNKYLSFWYTYRKSKMIIQEQALESVFQQYHQNDNFQNVIIKTSILNDFYSTSISDTYSVAKVIYEMNIDEKLAKNDLNLVNEIAKNTRLKCNSKRREYSFASKYCSFHKPFSFPIFDSRNEMILRYYKNAMEVKKFNLREDYNKYVEIIANYKKTFGLEIFSYKEIDRFNWILTNIVNDKSKTK